MTAAELSPPARPAYDRFAGSAMLLVSVIGAVYYARLITDGTFDFFHGRDWFAGAYNQYFLAILDGRLDIEPRFITFEGHYAPDGRAFVYHGLLPLLTRALAWPFVDLETRSLAPLTVWLASIGGGLVAADTLRLAIGRAEAGDGVRLFALLIALAAVWFASPVAVIAATAPLYHETVAPAFLAMMLFIRLSLPALWGDMPGPGRLVTLAVIAALAVHARPHVALGLYAGVALLLVAHWRTRSAGSGRSALVLAAGVAAILFLGGAGYLAINAARFGSMTMTQAAGVGGMIHGGVWLGMEPPNSVRWAEVEANGRFSPLRVVPVAIGHLTGAIPPWLTDAFGIGFIRLEDGVQGAAWLWLVWFAAATGAGVCVLFSAAKGAHRRGLPIAALVLATGIPALMILCYPTVTQRYGAEIWPLLFLAVVTGLGPLLAWTGARGPIGRLLIMALAGVALLQSATGTVVAERTVAGLYSNDLRGYPADGLRSWTTEKCLEWLAAPHNPPLAGPATCR